MKIISYIGFVMFLTSYSSLNGLSQSCDKFHLYSSCMQYPGASYKMDGQSRSNIIGLGDKLIYNVVFYGERNYKLFFCTSDLFNPVHYKLTDGVTKELIYDSKEDEFPETIELSIENTRKVKIEISVLAEKADKKLAENYLGCVGFLMNWKPRR